MAKKVDVVKELTKRNCAALGLESDDGVFFWFCVPISALLRDRIFVIKQYIECGKITLTFGSRLFDVYSTDSAENWNIKANEQIQPLFAKFQGCTEIDRIELKLAIEQAVRTLADLYKDNQRLLRAKLVAEYEAKLAEIDERITNPYFLQK